MIEVGVGKQRRKELNRTKEKIKQLLLVFASLDLKIFTLNDDDRLMSKRRGTQKALAVLPTDQYWASDVS